VPTDQIARSLAFVNWTVLTGLAVGTFLAVVVARFRTEATRGFLGFAAFCAAGFAILAALADTGLPVPGADAPIVATPELDGFRRALLVSFAILALAYVVVLRRGGKGPIVAGLALSAGFGAILVGAYGWAGGLPDAAPLAVQLVVLTISTGGVFAAMILGHWYLVSPKLPTEPLVLVARLLLAVVALQVLLFVVWLSTGAGLGLRPFEPFVGPWALFVWFRLLVGLAFPLVISWAALQAARTRSMESATGLLYIEVGAIAVGTILAAGLYFGVGLLV
jgi:hypothetical protein